MAFDFPASPSTGQVYKPSGGPSFAWDGVAWKAEMLGVPVTVYVADSAPVNPSVGQLWWDSDSGNLFIWFADPDSTQWVQVSGMPATAKPTALARNRICNPAMQISQENGDTGALIVGTNYYAADQWFGTSSIATTSITRQGTANSAPSGSSYVFVGVGTGKPSLAAGDYLQVIQSIEGSRVADFQWGTASAKQAVLRFSARAPLAGTYTVQIADGAYNRSFMAPFTFPTAGVWQTFTIVIPGDTTGTWPKDTAVGMHLVFGLAAGSTYATGVAGWQGSSPVQIAGHTNAASVTGYFLLTDVGLYLDPQNTGLPPAWVKPDEAEELQACQRYYTKYDSEFIVHGMASGAGAQANTPLIFRVKMRTNPAATWSQIGSNASGPSASGTTPDGCYFNTASLAAGAFYSVLRPIFLNARM